MGNRGQNTSIATHIATPWSLTAAEHTLDFEFIVPFYRDTISLLLHSIEKSCRQVTDVLLPRWRMRLSCFREGRLSWSEVRLLGAKICQSSGYPTTRKLPV